MPDYRKFPGGIETALGFDLIFAIDEIVSPLGFDEQVTDDQIKDYTEMDSAEAKLSEIIQLSKMENAKCLASRKNSNLNKNRNKNIGFALGGAKDINSFRLSIGDHKIPHCDSITFEGIFGEYYFDTNPNNGSDSDDTMENENPNENINKNKNKCRIHNDGDGTTSEGGTTVEGNEENEDEKKEEELERPLFYPSYSYSKSILPKCLRKDNNYTCKNTQSISQESNQDYYEFEHFLTIGLNSNMKETDFQRKKLNLIIVLDISGSMNRKFKKSKQNENNNHDDNLSKIKIATECISLLLKHLNSDDRFGLVTFNTESYVEIEMNEICDIDQKDFDKILTLEANGGTNMECGYNEAIEMFDSKSEWICDNDYENRMIFLTDARPNCGVTDSHGLISLVSNAANGGSFVDNSGRVYTTFVGIGVDFNSELISSISNIRGCNYFSVDSKKKFCQKLDSEFDYFVSPMVFNLKMTLFCEGGVNGGCIDKVFGDLSGNINVLNGEIMKINTLFASPPCQDDDCDDIKGGIVLIKLKNENIISDRKYFIQTEFEDKFGNLFNNTQNIQFNIDGNVVGCSYYANLGVRKGILLIRYVLLMKEWINSSDKEKKEDYSFKLQQFCKYFSNEMKLVKDDSLKQEMDILDKLIHW